MIISVDNLRVGRAEAGREFRLGLNMEYRGGYELAGRSLYKGQCGTKVVIMVWEKVTVWHHWMRGKTTGARARVSGSYLQRCPSQF